MDVLKGFCTGSIPMVGGHGTAGAFGLVLEKMGVEGASTLFCEGLSADPVGRKSVCRFYQQPCDHFIYQSFVAGRHKMFWNIRKTEWVIKYKVKILQFLRSTDRMKNRQKKWNRKMRILPSLMMMWRSRRSISGENGHKNLVFLR